MAKWSDAYDIAGTSKPADPIATEKTLTSFKPAMELLERASHKGHLAMHLDLDQGFLLNPPPKYAHFSEFVKAFAARAQANAAKGKSHLAAQNLATALRITALLGSEANAFNLLEQIACDLIILRITEFCVEANNRDPSALAEFSEVLEQNPVRPNLERALKLEAFLELATSRNLNLTKTSEMLERSETADLISGPLPVLTHVVRDGYPGNILGRACLCRVLQGWTSLGPALQASALDDDSFDAALTLKLKALNSERRMSFRESQTIFPVFEHLQLALKKRRAQELCDRALIQALIFRDKTDHFPTKVEQLPGTWTDPFAKGPLHLKLRTIGCRIYSLGPDGVDHHGVAREETENRDYYNLVAAFPPVQNRSYPHVKG